MSDIMRGTHEDLVDERATLLLEYIRPMCGLHHRLVCDARGNLRVDFYLWFGDDDQRTRWIKGSDEPDASTVIAAYEAMTRRFAQPVPLTPRADELRLCFLYEGVAYFTTQPVTEQWGDGWNDAPYESNAGVPYEYRGGEKNPDGEPKDPWTIIRAAFGGDFLTPNELCGSGDSPYSVERINAGLVPWLTRWERQSKLPAIRLFAGATLTEFVDFITSNGGTVYMTKEDWER